MQMYALLEHVWFSVAKVSFEAKLILLTNQDPCFCVEFALECVSTFPTENQTCTQLLKNLIVYDSEFLVYYYLFALIPVERLVKEGILASFS